MAYTVLARRYRSQRFDDVVGQDAISQTLKNAIKTGRVAHAYLFTGTRGVGKTTMARILAKSLNCLSAKEPTIEPCLKCDSCTAVNTGEDIDVIEIDGASNTGVDDIRNLRQNAIYRPARARYKIYIIDEVHMISVNAFNALLKILEEPPSHVKFIFATTEPNKVPATIQSRCQRFDFANISPADIMAQLKKILTEEKINFEDDCIIALARLARGSMRDALSLVDQLISTGVEKLTVDMLEKFLGQPNKEKIYQLLEKIGSSDAGAALVCLDALLNCGLNCIGVLDSLVESFRDMMVLKVSASDSKSLIILTQGEKESLLKIAGGFDIPAIVYNVTLFEKLRWPVKNSDNPRALLEAAILRLALSEHFMSIQELLSSAKGCLTAQNSNIKTESKKNTVVTHKTQNIEHRTQNAELKSAQADKPQISDLKSQTPVISGGAGLEQIKQQWDKIVEFARAGANARVAELLKKAVPLRLANDTLSLGFDVSDEFSMKLCQSNGRQDVIESVLSGSVGMKIKVAFETVNNGGKVEQKPKPPGAKTSKKTIDEAANTPAIRTILSELDANILDVKEEGQ
ncbi:MAG: DNA polymerase III subunit gamma/tau [Phycisphaerae bacterium]|nr:DNA polymerase III subunit gamma/tau [Phycisphaerae bacterium]